MKNTKRSLFFSITALILCCALLAGTTMAWFTDSVTSGVNTITAGNLDVELYRTSRIHSGLNPVTADTNDLFKDVTLWEPGAYAYETFTVKNEGNLALKYQLKLNVVGRTTVGAADLADVLRVKEVPSVPGTRPSSSDPVWANGYKLANWSYNSGDEELQKGESKEVTVVIYWIPGENDNQFNMNNANQGKALSLDVGVQLIATQTTVEEDSFDNQYDAPAIYPALAPIVSQTISYGAQVDGNGNLTQEIDQADMKIPQGTLLSDDTGAAISGTNDGKLEREMKTVGGDSESVTVQINYHYKTDTSNTPVTNFSNVVENMTQLSTGLNITKVIHTKHDGSSDQLQALDTKPTTITDGVDAHYYYEATTGKLYIYSKDYSPFQIFYTSDFVASVNGQGYGSLEEAVGIAHTAPSDATVTLLKNVALTKDLQLGSRQRGVNLNLNGKTIDGGEYQLYTAGDGTINIFGSGTIKTATDSDIAPLCIFNGSHAILDGVTLEGYYGVYANGTLEIKNAVINAVDCGIAANHSARVTVGVESGDSIVTVTASNGNCISTQAAQGATEMNVTVYNGSFTSSGIDWTMCPIYWASHGTLNVYGGTFENNTPNTDAAGLYQKNGVVNIYDGNFTSRCGLKLGAEENNSTEITLNVSGGTFTGTKHAALYYKTTAAGSNCTTYNINISGGQFTGHESKGAIYKSCVAGVITPTVSITGGSFNTNPSAYLATGYEASLKDDRFYHVEKIEYWKDHAATSYATPVDSENKVVTIASAGELALLANEIRNGTKYQGYKISISKDIDLSAYRWNPIMDEWKDNDALNGSTIQGNGHTISGMKAYHDYASGLLGYCASTLTVENLAFSNCSSSTKANQSQTYAGILVGKTYSSITCNNVDLKNCNVANNWQCGGLIGFAEGNPVYFSNCDVVGGHFGGYNATAGVFFGLGEIDVSVTDCTAKNVQLYTDSLTWNSTAKNVGNFAVGHLYGKTLTKTNYTETDVTVVSQ